MVYTIRFCIIAGAIYIFSPNHIAIGASDAVKSCYSLLRMFEHCAAGDITCFRSSLYVFFNRHFTIFLIYIKKLVSLADRQRVWRTVDHAVRHKCSNVRAIDRSVVQYVYCAPP